MNHAENLAQDASARMSERAIARLMAASEVRCERRRKKGGVRLNHPVEIMRFTLIFDGRLPAQSSHDSRVSDKQAIRRCFHEQLREIWETKPVLRKHYENWKLLDAEQQEAAKSRDMFWMQPFDAGNFRFIPLVTERRKLICELDILFLRTEPAGSLFTTNKAGDLDNRLKVLFDALRVPQDAGELPQSAKPTDSENPFLCLLQNDNLITAVRLESDRLYGPPTPRDYVRLVVKVTVKAQEFSYETIDVAND